MDREAHKEHRGLGAPVEGIAREVFEAGLTVHRVLGPGLLESTYEHCFAFELHSRKLAVSRQLALPIAYRAVTLDAGYRLDLLVGDAVVVEIKAVEALTRLHEAQVLTYLKHSGCRLGFLMNFNVDLFKNGVHRLIR